MRRLAYFLLICLPLIAAASFGADAVAELLMRIGLNDQASILVRDPIVKGQALYAARHWSAAAAVFRAQGDTQSYNLGNALARAGELEQAIRAYDVALERDPDDEDAAFNRALVVELQKATSKTAAVAAAEGYANSSATAERTGAGTSDDTGKGELKGSGDGHVGGQEVGSQSYRPGGSKVSKAGTSGKSTLETSEGQALGSAGDAEGKGRHGSALTEAIGRFMRRSSGKVWEGQSVLPTQHWLDALADDPGKFLKLRLAAERAQRLHAAALGGGAR
jgi:Ca-activated chloride channel homolog